MANEEVQAFGKTILEGVPDIMNALEALTAIHPFLKGMVHHPSGVLRLMLLVAAYLPFQLIYHQ